MESTPPRRFVIRKKNGEQVGEGTERPDGTIEARFPFSLDGVPIGDDFSQWDDAELARVAIEATGCSIESIDPESKTARLTGNWAHDYWVYFPNGDPLGLGSGYEYNDADGGEIKT